MATDNSEKLKAIIEKIEPGDRFWTDKAKIRTSHLVMPIRALGRLHDIAEQICGIQKTLSPSIERKAILVMAGDHGIAKYGVSAYPQETTGAMVKTFLSGGAGINAISRHVGADIRIVDMGIIPEIDPNAVKGGEKLILRKMGHGTDNFLEGPAMSRETAEKAVLTGFRQASFLFDKGIDLLGTGDMGIGNTTPSAAIGSVIAETDPADMTGRGTGVDDDGLSKKVDAVRKGIEKNRPDPKDGIDVLSKVGGFEIAGIAGCILAGAFRKQPVVIDGFISTAGAMIAYALCPTVTDYIIAGHCSEEAGHEAMLKFLQLEPVLDLNMRLGEGSGAAVAMGVIDCAIKVFKEMATFEEAHVPHKQ